MIDNKIQSLLKLTLLLIVLLMVNCQSLQSPRCEIDYKKIRDLQCYPITSYQKWNECVSSCTNQLKVKSKPYDPESNPWTRPRPYVYPWHFNYQFSNPYTIMDCCICDRTSNLRDTNACCLYLHSCTIIFKSI